MDSEAHSQEVATAAHAEDTAHAAGQPHSHEEEVAHAWHHFYENVKFFAGFFTIIILTVLASLVNFGAPWNTVSILVLAAARSGLIAFFLSSLFKNFSFVFRTLCFTILFLGGMIFLSLWDSKVPPIGNPIVLPPKYHFTP
jgi:ABC-type antimicrobial peptide transport system permease subunit